VGDEKPDARKDSEEDEEVNEGESEGHRHHPRWEGESASPPGGNVRPLVPRAGGEDGGLANPYLTALSRGSQGLS